MLTLPWPRSHVRIRRARANPESQDARADRQGVRHVLGGATRACDSGLAEGDALRGEIERLLHDARVRYIHLCNAKRGCFSCKVERMAPGRAVGLCD